MKECNDLYSKLIKTKIIPAPTSKEKPRKASKKLTHFIKNRQK